jgi:hypothetical protein
VTRPPRRHRPHGSGHPRPVFRKGDPDQRHHQFRGDARPGHRLALRSPADASGEDPLRPLRLTPLPPRRLGGRILGHTQLGFATVALPLCHAPSQPRRRFPQVSGTTDTFWLIAKSRWNHAGSADEVAECRAGQPRWARRSLTRSTRREDRPGHDPNHLAGQLGVAVVDQRARGQSCIRGSRGGTLVDDSRGRPARNAGGRARREAGDVPSLADSHVDSHGGGTPAHQVEPMDEGRRRRTGCWRSTLPPRSRAGGCPTAATSAQGTWSSARPSWTVWSGSSAWDSRQASPRTSSVRATVSMPWSRRSSRGRICSGRLTRSRRGSGPWRASRAGSICQARTPGQGLPIGSPR